TERACSPSRLRSIGNRGYQARIYHRGADAEQQAADQPVLEVMCQCGEQKPCGLNPHPGDNQALSSPPVAQWTGRDLQNAPGRWIDRFENADPFNAEAERGKEQGKNAPAHTIVEIVNETGLRCGKEIAIAKRCEGKNVPKVSARRVLLVVFDLEMNMTSRVTHEKN